MSEFKSLVKSQRIIPILRTSNLNIGVLMAEAIAMAGMKLLEVTWTSDEPTRLIELLRDRLPNCLIGAGTITTPQQLQEAIACGVEFIFCPYFHPKVMEIALNYNIPIIPGALSPTEIFHAWEAGAAFVKVFPVNSVGGVNYIRSMQEVCGEIPLIPTGGVKVDNAAEFIRAGASAVGIATDLFPHKLVNSQQWAVITQRAAYLLSSLSGNTYSI